MSVLIRWESCNHIQHNSVLGGSNDWVYFTEISKLGPVGYIDESLGVYHRHSQNIAKSRIDHASEETGLLYLQKKYNLTTSAEKDLINLFVMQGNIF